MCTSIVTKSLDDKHFLSRTMDFGFELGAVPAFCPRNYEWVGDTDQKKYNTTYSLVGAGKNLGKYIFADGINECGLSCASLYLPGEVNYSPSTVSDKINLAPHEFLLWILSTCSSIEELRNNIKKINLVDSPVALLGITTPLHWIITDKTGKTVVIEPTTTDLELLDNPVDVMTNSPQLDWHIQNLRNYLGLNPNQKDDQVFGTYKAIPFSQGTGTSRLPGSFTPPDRFVRAAFLKEYIQPAKNEEEAITNIWYILDSVRIPKGVVLKRDGSDDYTQYTAAMCSESLIYYFTPYGNNSIQTVQLTTDMIEHQKEPLEFAVQENQGFYSLNQ